jgi:hypothetical protein
VCLFTSLTSSAVAQYTSLRSKYVDKAEKLTKEIMRVDDWELDDLFWGDPPDKEELSFTLQKIIDNIEKIKKIPIKKRHYD